MTEIRLGVQKAASTTLTTAPESRRACRAVAVLAPLCRSADPREMGRDGPESCL